MRQILLNSSGARIARVPRPVAAPGAVLVRVHYSLISVGTEVAPLRASALDAATGGALATGETMPALVARYFRASLRDPAKAARRVREIAEHQVARARALMPAAPPPATVGGHKWTACSPGVKLEAAGGALSLTTDDSAGGYQAITTPIEIPAGANAIVRVHGSVDQGAIAIGVLDDTQQRWLLTRTYTMGSLDDELYLESATPTISLVLSSAGAPPPSRVTLVGVDVRVASNGSSNATRSDLTDTGWNVGYSAAGEVIEVGEGIADLAPGDLVACAGAGLANHADYVVVPRNLVCRVPKGCSTRAAASTTVGAIALQGVRRADLQLGETAAVIGLGLIGQITVQLLRAAGCKVVGLDLSESRLARARELGLDDGTSDPEAFKALVRDYTGGRGADATLMTAATKSDAIVNLAMEVTRAKGRAVIVGDIGLNVQRATWYRKEIDLLMSTSYGPGRYDTAYEQGGQDYPFGYVRWTLNRNMQAYMELIARGQLQFDPLVDRVVNIEDASEAYRELADDRGEPPLGVLLRYGSDAAAADDLTATRITLRGHRTPPSGPTKWALVGAGAFGTAMLVPQMQKRGDAFFLQAVVSRTAAQAGNFARERRVPVVTSHLADVLRDPDIGLIVIATRHHEHADQVIECLEAGKHVFVEKPLAITWEQLESVVQAVHAREDAPILMVGFNRRFSPALVEVRELTAKRRAPLVIQYRLNAGYIPLDHWVHGAQGGGRNIGEACHMYDVFRSLAGAPVTSVAASAIAPGGLPYFRNDNFSATLTYDDGTLATLTYTALGPKTGLGKERIEIFCDGETYVVDDFKTLTRASDGVVLWEGREIDKGHALQMSLLADAVTSGSAAPVPFDEIVETSAVALQVEDLLAGRASDRTALHG
jgi:predicted dehydrogenase/threonine dehydrogenase-like Zn-dependent dehydrogenase